MRRLTTVLFLLALLVLVGSCSANDMAKDYGGSVTYDLPAGKKLINATWKESDLWYLVRDMRPGEEPETYQFIEKSSMGLLEGTVTLVEHAK